MTLYHYTSGQGLFGILDNAELHCSNVNFMNDPSENTYFSSLLDQVVKDSENAKLIHDSLFNQTYQDAFINSSEMFVASFCKNNDSLSMWNYYAKGNGYNLGIDIDKVIEDNKREDVSIQKIELLYDKTKQLEKIHEFFSSLSDYYKEYLQLEEDNEVTKSEVEYMETYQRQTQIEADFTDRLHQLRLQFKHHAYEREQEVRILIMEAPYINESFTRFKVYGNGVFVQYFPLTLKCKECLESVTIHPLNGDLHVEGTTKFLHYKLGVNNVSVSVSIIPFRIV